MCEQPGETDDIHLSDEDLAEPGCGSIMDQSLSIHHKKVYLYTSAKEDIGSRAVDCPTFHCDAAMSLDNSRPCPIYGLNSAQYPGNSTRELPIGGECTGTEGTGLQVHCLHADQLP